MIIALDLGTRTGYAVRLDNNAIASGVLDLKPRRHEGGGMRYLKFAGHLDRIAETERPKLLVYEEVRRHAGTDAAHVYGGLLGIVSAWCEGHKIPYEGVPVGTIKKFWTGNGNASKELMIRKAGELGFLPEDDNEADALALLHWALEERAGAISIGEQSHDEEVIRECDDRDP